MQFLILAYDGDDAEAQARRQSMRAAHLQGARAMKEQGSYLEGGAILDDEGRMIGSALVMQFGSLEECEAYVASDPYTVGKVWQKVEIKAFRRAPV